MNCFNNNAPKISASEHLHNKRTKVLYKSNRGMYRNKQYTSEILLKKNGTIKNVSNYQAKRDIAKGYYLSNCNNVCSNIDLQTIKINTGANSIYNKFDGSKGCLSDCSSGFPVLYSKGYRIPIELKVVDTSENVINKFSRYPLDDNHIIIDPANFLFGTNDCKKKYLQYTSYDKESEKCNKNTQQNYMQHLYRNNIGNITM